MSAKSAKIVGSNPAPPVEPLTPWWPKRSYSDALLFVGEHGVRLGRFLEALFGLVVAGIAVGVVLQRELAVGALDLPISGLPLELEDLVVVALAHARPHCAPFATFTIDGRSSRSPSM